VDDETLARERIRFLLRDEPDVGIARECDSGEEAIEQIVQQTPDLLFLDIQMPGVDGFEVLQQIPTEKLPVVIFTTAFDQHAVRAFEAHALDYLLKPFKPARFKEAVQRARDHLANRQTGEVARGLVALVAERATLANQQPLSRIAVKTESKITFVAVHEIDSIESAGNYVLLRVGKESHILRETLTALEGRLPAKQFLRISRAAIVNLDHVKELLPVFEGDSVVVLRNGRSIPTTRNLREIQERMQM
jgi:two-component system LytT family response regulator